MGLPKLVLDEHGRVSTRQPVPVRYALLAADWSPALFAEIVRGPGGDVPPLLTVYAFDTATGYVGQVRKNAYDTIRSLKAPLQQALAAIPPHHFVWSDDLELAYSEYVDLTTDRKTAAEEGMGIRWKPDLGNLGGLVAEAVDLSPLMKAGDYRCSASNNVRTFVFDSKSVMLKDSTGLRYISHLLFHPGEPFPTAILDRVVRPSVATQGMHESGVEDEDSAVQDPRDSPDELSTIDPRGDFGDTVFDDDAIADIKKKLSALREQLEDQKLRGNLDKADKIEEEIDEIERHLIAGRNKSGKSRRLGSAADKLRKSVGNAIARALDSLDDAHPALAKHLRATITTGSDCVYRPAESVRWTS